MPDIVEAPIMLAFQHWQRVGFSVQTSMVLELAAYGVVNQTMHSALEAYVRKNTNLDYADLFAGD